MQVQTKTNDISLPLLKIGSSGESVRLLQKILLKLGYDLAFNATYDNVTVAAVVRFQADNNIGQTGQVGDQTWHALTDQL
ncbi:MAG: peptidoglycan-binding protein [Nostocaceae cyanobacterium]|nr:peptidoglycan-binding protein [Nostocaceae cyanobacterium]